MQHEVENFHHMDSSQKVPWVLGLRVCGEAPALGLVLLISRKKVSGVWGLGSCWGFRIRKSLGVFRAYETLFNNSRAQQNLR